MNQTKKGLKKKKAKDIKFSKSKRKEQFKINIIFNILCSLMLFIIISICLALLISNSTNNSDIGLLLAMISLFVTFAYEIYEWINLKKKRKNITTIPFLFSGIFTVLLTMFKLTNIRWKLIINYSNHICAITLFGYIIMVTLRTIKINIKEIERES